MVKSKKTNKKSTIKLGVVRKSGRAAHPSQNGIMSLIIVFFLSLAAFLWTIDQQKMFEVRKLIATAIDNLVIGPEITFSVMCLVFITLLIWVKDKLTLVFVKEKQRQLANVAHVYNERFNEVQTAMIAHYSLYDQESVTAINEARALLGTLIQRLINVGLFLGGSQRIHIYDALDQVTQPLEFGENSVSVILTCEPFRTTSLRDLEERLDELLEIGEKPLEGLSDAPDGQNAVITSQAA